MPPSWPKRVADLVTRCWSDEPSERPQFAEIAADFEKLEAEASQTPAEGEENELVLGLSGPVQASSSFCIVS